MRGRVASTLFPPPPESPGIDVWNPAFDVTPHDLITGGIVTEWGVFAPAELRQALAERGGAGVSKGLRLGENCFRLVLFRHAVRCIPACPAQCGNPEAPRRHGPGQAQGSGQAARAGGGGGDPGPGGAGAAEGR